MQSIGRVRRTALAHALDVCKTIESDTGYDTRRRWLEGVRAGVSQTAVYDTC